MSIYMLMFEFTNAIAHELDVHQLSPYYYI